MKKHNENNERKDAVYRIRKTISRLLSKQDEEEKENERLKKERAAKGNKTRKNKKELKNTKHTNRN